MTARRDDGYNTAEEAALAGWADTPAANAVVVGVEPMDDPNFPGGVWVTVQTNGHPGFHDQDIASCTQDENGNWHENGSTGSSSSGSLS